MNKYAFTDTVHSFSRICINWRRDMDEASPPEQWHRFFSLCVGIGMADGSWRIDEITKYHRRLRILWSGRWHCSEESRPTYGELVYAWLLESAYLPVSYLNLRSGASEESMKVVSRLLRRKRSQSRGMSLWWEIPLSKCWRSFWGCSLNRGDG